MKRLIRKVILFSLLPLLFVFTYDLYLRNMNTLYRAKYDGLIDVKDEIEVLFLGNSHANYAVNPKHFQDFTTYNLAMVNQTIYFDKRLTMKVIDEGMPNLKYLFISVDYHSLFTSSQGVRDVWSYYAYGIKHKEKDYKKEVLSPFIWGYTPRVSFSFLKKDIKRYLKYGKSTVNFDVENGVDVRDSLYYGFIGLDSSDVQSFNKESYQIKADVFKEDISRSEREEVLEDLNDFILLLKQQNIESILFSSPTYNEYNSCLDTSQIQRNLDDILTICKAHAIPYWRFNEDVRFTKEDFYNQDHLNKKGAAKFSQILNDELKKTDHSKSQK